MHTKHQGDGGAPSHWAVVNSRPQQEHIAVDNLQRQAFDVYCPMVRRQLRHSRRVRDVLRPLFPGYLFAQVNPEVHHWRPLLSTLGVRTVVRSGDQLSLIDDAFIQSLKNREVDGIIARPARPYSIGEEVCMAGGAFDGLVATIIDMDEGDRLTVLMNLLNRPVKVKIEKRHVSPV